MMRDNMICRECGQPMELGKRRKHRTGSYVTEDRHVKYYWVELGDYNCTNCGTVMREGVSKEHDIWLPGIFRVPKRAVS